MPQKPIHAICQILGETLTLYPSAVGGFGVDSSKLVGPNIVAIFGYNFRGDALPSLDLTAANGTLIRRLNVTPAYVTQYQLTVDFGGENFIGAAPGSRVVFRWPDQTEPNTITLSLVSPARLKFGDSCVFKPANPTTSDQVFLFVTLTNTGQDVSHAFQVKWTPQGGPTLKSGLQSPLKRSETRGLWISDSHIFRNAGLNTNEVAIDNGDDSVTCNLSVWPSPPVLLPPVVDHDTRRYEMHACPEGRFMSGIHRGNDLLLCEWYGGASGEVIDSGTNRSGVRACPLGYAMTGMHLARNEYACAPLKTDSEGFYTHGNIHTRLGMGACLKGEVLTGYNADSDTFLCAHVTEFNH